MTVAGGDGFRSVRRTAFHGMVAALPISAAMWIAIVALAALLR